MSRTKLTYYTLLFSSLLWISPANSADKESPDAQPEACISFSTSVRYVIGYDHLVSVHNGCEKLAECIVKNDVNSEVQKLKVQPQSSELTVTQRGSASRVFQASVSCSIDGKSVKVVEE